MTVAEFCDLLTGEVFVEGAVINDNEVVAGSIHFGESEIHGREYLDCVSGFDQRGDEILEFLSDVGCVGVVLDGANDR